MPTILIDSCPRNQQLRLPLDIGFSVEESTILTTSMYRKAPPNSEVERLSLTTNYRSRKQMTDKVQMRPLHASLPVRKQHEQLTSSTPVIRKECHDLDNGNPSIKKRSSSKNRRKEPLHYVDYIEDCKDMQSNFEKQNFNPRAKFSKGEVQKSLEIVMNSRSAQINDRNKISQGKEQIVMKRNEAGSGSATPFSSSMRRARLSHFHSESANETSMPFVTQAERKNRRMYNKAREGEIARNCKASAINHHDNDKSMDFSELYNHDKNRDLQSSTDSSFSASGQSLLSDSENKAKPILRKSSLTLQESNLDLKCRQPYPPNPLSARTGERPTKHEQMVRKPCVSFSPYTTVFHGERRVNPEKASSKKCEKNLTIVNVKTRGSNGMSENTNTSTGKEEIEAPKRADEDMRQIKKISQILMAEIHQKLLRRNVFSRKTNSPSSIEVQGPTPGEIHNQMRLAAANAAFEAISKSNKV